MGLLLRCHKPMIFSLVSATTLHLLLFGVPVSYKGAMANKEAGISTLSVKIAPFAVPPAVPEPAKPDVPEIIKSAPSTEKIISTASPKNTHSAVVPNPKPSEKKLQKIAEPSTPEPEPQALEHFQTSIDDELVSPDVPQKSQQADPMKEWLAVLQQRINNNRRYPRAALSRGMEGDVEIEARVNPDGSLAEARIVSGSKLFRNASLQALRKSLPFSPPQDTREPISFRFTIHYRLN